MSEKQPEKDVKSTKKTEKNVKNIEKSTKNTKKTVKNDEKTPKNIKVLGFHDLKLNTIVFDNVEKPKAVVLIIHGMQEHILRYTNFAKFLEKNGYIVVMSDLRGHGGTMVSKDDYGRGEKDIFTETIQDQLNLLNFIHEQFKLPIYIFGHSYGSMLTQRIVQLSPLPQKAVICGTTNGSSSLFKLGNVALKIITPFQIHDKRGGIAEKLCIKGYSKKFENGNWLTRDEAVFQAYVADELCGGSFPFSFYRSMVKNMGKINKRIDKIGDKKLFLISGSQDIVGEYGKQVKKLYKIYLKHKVNARMKLYDGARHELLNEINKEEVYKDVLDFFNE